LYIDGFAAGDLSAGLAQSPLDQVAPARRGAVWLGSASAAALHLALAGAAGWLATTSPSPSRVEPALVTQMVEVPVELEPPPLPVPPAEPEPEPAPAKALAEPAPAAPAPAPRAAPAAAQASEVLAQEPAAEEIVDFSETFVQGTAATYAGGVSAAAGTSEQAVRAPGARAQGVIGGTGTDTSGVNRSRAPALAGGATWDCPFPREAELEEIDDAVVALRVRVSREGSVEDVSVERDPGSGFGREAMRCARNKRWAPGLDAAGNPAAMTSRVNVRFIRSN
jgi:protein TonB